jgi:16S rRNA (uracil1498-N3)-methyltransferase
MVRLLSPLPDAAGGTLEIDGERYHYLFRVLRLSEGDTLEVFDGQGSACAATVKKVEEGRALLHLGARKPQPRQALALTLLQGIPKGEKWEWVLQKGTELGADCFIPCFTERTVVKLSFARSEEKRRRWQKIVEEAARQSGRPEVPAVGAPLPLLEAARGLPKGTALLLLHAGDFAVGIEEAWAQLGSPASVALCVGPEGGFSAAEVEGLRSLGAIPIFLGKRTLRTETAALAALTLVLHLSGQLRPGDN